MEVFPENNEVKITHSWIFHGIINYKNIVSKNQWKKIGVI